MDDIDSLKLALEAEKHNHQKDNEYLLARAKEAEAKLARLRDFLEAAAALFEGDQSAEGADVSERKVPIRRAKMKKMP